MSAPSLMGMDMMAFIMKKLNECDTSDLMEEYEKISDELAEALDTGE